LGRGEESVQEITITGIVEDGMALNAAVKELRGLGVSGDDLTVVLKRGDTSSTEPFPEGTRYIIVPDDRRGLEVPIGFSIAFIVFGLFFAITTPSIGIPTFLIFIALTTILWAGALTRVGVDPILTDMGAPGDEATNWNDAFEKGSVLIFAVVRERRLIRPIREVLQRHEGSYYLNEGRMEPRALHQAVMRRAGSWGEAGEQMIGSYEDR
jgi:hypothetical protein